MLKTFNENIEGMLLVKDLNLDLSNYALEIYNGKYHSVNCEKPTGAGKVIPLKSLLENPKAFICPECADTRGFILTESDSGQIDGLPHVMQHLNVIKATLELPEDYSDLTFDQILEFMLKFDGLYESERVKRMYSSANLPSGFKVPKEIYTSMTEYTALKRRDDIIERCALVASSSWSPLAEALQEIEEKAKAAGLIYQPHRAQDLQNYIKEIGEAESKSSKNLLVVLPLYTGYNSQVELQLLSHVARNESAPSGIWQTKEALWRFLKCKNLSFHRHVITDETLTLEELITFAGMKDAMYQYRDDEPEDAEQQAFEAAFKSTLALRS